MRKYILLMILLMPIDVFATSMLSGGGGSASTIAQGNITGLTTGDVYTNFGIATDDTLNELLAAIDSAWSLAGAPTDATYLTSVAEAGLSAENVVSANGLSLVTAADYAAMKALLDLDIGTDVQAYDADLTTWATITPSADGSELVQAADYAAMKALLDLEIGTDVQAYDADLTTWAGISPSANVQSLLGAADYAAFKALIDTDDLQTLTGIAAGTTHLGTFTGTTIDDSVTIKVALQSLETAVEGVGALSIADVGYDDLDEASALTPTGAVDLSGASSVSIGPLQHPGATDGQIMVYNETDDSQYNNVTMSGDISITKAGVVTIDESAVEFTMLKSINLPTDEYVLSYEADSSEFEWILGGGDITSVGDCDTGDCTDDFIGASDMADSDHGDVNWTNNTAYVQAIHPTNDIDASEYNISNVGSIGADSVVADAATIVIGSGNDNVQILADSSPDDDDTYSAAFAFKGVAGESVTQWDLVYLNDSDAQYHQSDADITGEFPARAMVIEAGGDGSTVTLITQGIVRNDGWNWSGEGSTLYLSATAGGLTETAPTGDGSCVQVVGWTISDDEAYINISGHWGLDDGT